MNEGFTDMFLFHQWANARLLDFCEKLDDAVLDHDLAGTYGTIRGALAHMIGTQNGFLFVVVSPPPATYFDGMPVPDFDILRQAMDLTDAAALHAAQMRDLEEVLTGEFQGRRYEMKLKVPLIQYLNHGIEHRTQVQSILGAQGIEPPILNAWVWGGVA
jgi:uncharacterized damage-inducible protein DinB